MNSVFCISLASLAKLAEVRCPGLHAETLFVLLLKFVAVLSTICGFLVAVYIGIHLLHCCLAVVSEVNKTP